MILREAKPQRGAWPLDSSPPTHTMRIKATAKYLAKMRWTSGINKKSPKQVKRNDNLQFKSGNYFGFGREESSPSRRSDLVDSFTFVISGSHWMEHTILPVRYASSDHKFSKQKWEEEKASIYLCTYKQGNGETFAPSNIIWRTYLTIVIRHVGLKLNTPSANIGGTPAHLTFSV